MQTSGLLTLLFSYVKLNLDPLLKINSSEPSSRVLSESKQIIGLQRFLYATQFVVDYLFSFDSLFHLCLVSSSFLTACSETLVSLVTAGFEQETGLNLSAEKIFKVHSIPKKQTLFTLFPSVSLPILFMISLLSTVFVSTPDTQLHSRWYVFRLLYLLTPLFISVLREAFGVRQCCSYFASQVAFCFMLLLSQLTSFNCSSCLSWQDELVYWVHRLPALVLVNTVEQGY